MCDYYIIESHINASLSTWVCSFTIEVAEVLVLDKVLDVTHLVVHLTH